MYADMRDNFKEARFKPYKGISSNECANCGVESDLLFQTL